MASAISGHSYRQYTFPALTAVGTTDYLPVHENHYHTFIIDLTGDPSGVTRYRIEHSIDGSVWSGFDCSSNTGTDGSENPIGQPKIHGKYTHFFKDQMTKYVRVNVKSMQWTTAKSLTAYYFGG